MTDEAQLRILSIYYYVVTFMLGFTLLMYPFGAMRDTCPPGQAYCLSGAALVAVMLVLLAAYFFTAYSIARRRNYVFCIVMAVITCLNFPIGTIFGIWTLWALRRSSVKMLFAR